MEPTNHAEDRRQITPISKNTCLLKHFPPNPSLEFVENLEKEIPLEVSHLIAQGGGSTIDGAKWIANKRGIKLTAIPTTAGTGSEVTKYCVLTVDGKKKTFDFKVPDSYVLDPRLVVTLPKLHTIASGVDALSQALEALWSKNATQESKEYSSIAYNLIIKSLKKSIAQPMNEKLRADTLIAANFSGRAIDITKTNVCHAISYPLTDLYGIPHGIACGMSLSYFAKLFLNLDLKELLQILPKYEFDVEKVASIAIQSKKLEDCHLPITKGDIIASLS